MKDLVLTSGNWTAGGNFSGYDEELGRVHIFGAQMKAIGLENGSTITFPLFGRGEYKTIQVRDAQGELTEQTAERLTAISVYKDAKSFNAVKLAKEALKIDFQQQRKELYSSANLTEEEVNALLEAAI